MRQDIVTLRQIVEALSYKDWAFKVGVLGDAHYYLQVAFNAPSNVTGESQAWTGRKWLLSPHATDSEVVLTALKAVITAEEHETREQFKFHGQAVFDPHTSIHVLFAVSRMEKDVRPSPVGVP